MVRSKSEVIIANLLHEREIRASGLTVLLLLCGYPTQGASQSDRY
jgi:hypothetical protein